MKFLSFLVLATLISCSTGTARQDIDSGPYRSSGVEQFFLAEVPNWANYSALGLCYKHSSVHYMDFSKLIETYQLTYPQMIELQAQYNERLENYFRSTTVRFLKPVEQASFFSNSLEQVRGGVKSLKLPLVKAVEILWLEGSTPADIKKLAAAGKFNERLPILFSSCHSRQSLNQWVIENSLEDVGFYLLSAEWLSPFSSKGVPFPGARLDIAELLGPDIKYSFLSTLNKQTTELAFP